MFPFAVFSGNFIYKRGPVSESTSENPVSERLSPEGLSPEGLSPERLSPKEFVGEEFAAEDLSADSFTFRLPQAFPYGQTPVAFLLHFADKRGRSEYTMTLRDFTLEKDRDAWDSPFYVTYRCITESREFSGQAIRVLTDYETYVRLKTTEPDDVLSHAMTGYPQGLENDFYTSWEAQKRALFSELSPDCDWGIPASVETGISLDRPALLEQFLKLPYSDFLQAYFHNSGLIPESLSRGPRPADSFLPSKHSCSEAADSLPPSKYSVSEGADSADFACHPLTGLRPRYLYLGNEGCIHLLPSSEQFPRLIGKAALEGLTPVLVLPPVKEREFDRILRQLSEWRMILKENNFDDTELVVNDWGMVKSAPEGYRITAGSMLLKRRKDVRLPYLHEPNRSKQPESNLPEPDPGFRSGNKSATPVSCSRPEDWVCTLAPSLLDQLSKRCEVQHLLLEACGYEYALPDDSRFRKTLLLPFYHMNTAPDCTLYAACKNGERGRQEPVLFCPGYCREQAFLYPKHLSMAGIGNSLMGIDLKILQNENYLKAMLDQGISRLVFNFQ